MDVSMQTSYGRAAAEVLINSCGDKNLCREFVDCKDHGVWPNAPQLGWKPCWELDGPDAPDPLETPSLPIPFTVNELAAFMLDGAGAFLTTVYGAWEHGPDENVLQSLDDSARKVKEALRGAYVAYRGAEIIVGKFDNALEVKYDERAHKYEAQLAKINRREGAVNRNRFTPEEYWERRARAKKSVGTRFNRLRAARQEAIESRAVWRKAMVNELLQPKAATDASEVTEGKGWTAERIAKVQAYRHEHGATEAAAHFRISRASVNANTRPKAAKQKAAESLRKNWDRKL